MLDEQLIKAAGTRALRTLLQGLLAGGVINGIVALLAEGGDPQALLVSALTVVGAAVASFIQGVLAGLPETAPVELTASLQPHESGVTLTRVAATRGDEFVAEGYFDLTPAPKPRATRKS